MIYHPFRFPFSPIAPVSIIWKSEPFETEDEKTIKTLMIQIHPIAEEEFLLAFKNGIRKMNLKSVFAINRKFQLCKFEIRGPDSQLLLNRVLTWSQNQSGQNKKNLSAFQVWNDLKNIRTSSSLPKNAIFGGNLQDPRLSFPPKKKKVTEKEAKQAHLFLKRYLLWSKETAVSNIWDQDVCLSCLSFKTDSNLNSSKADSNTGQKKGS